MKKTGKYQERGKCLSVLMWYLIVELFRREKRELYRKSYSKLLKISDLSDGEEKKGKKEVS